jgi:putative tryptophan/tyrosine transport system substrate-binding protein
MNRREFITFPVSAATWPITARAQQAQIPRMGVLLVGSREPFLSLFLAGLRDLGYVGEIS